ncbi:MAG TPA: hypothetical protein VNU49_06285 [Opitutaceae bacterium]|jgi:hypothetical protein|nr:hypothetical protein [Opitutaceae bacterium]
MDNSPSFWVTFNPEAAAAAVGALVEVVLGWFLLSWFFVRKADLTALIERACDGLDQLKKDCAKYWLSEAIELKESKRYLLEAKIKTGVLAVISAVLHIKGKYMNLPEEMRSRILDLQEACTGGDFERVERHRDLRRYMEIANKVHALQRSLHGLKLPALVALGLRKRPRE